MITRVHCLCFVAIASTTLLLLTREVRAADDGEMVDPTEVEQEDPTLINDLRLEYGVLPVKANISNRTQNGQFAITEIQKTTTFDSTGRTSLYWMTPWSEIDTDGGFLFGLELSTNHYILKADGVNPHISYRANALTLHPGIGWDLADRLTLEITPMLGAGFARTSFGSGTGLYWEIGIQGSLIYTFMNRIQIGLNLQALETRDRQSVPGDGTNFDVRIRTDGVGGGLTIGYRFQ
jgi:hypothetical protein